MPVSRSDQITMEKTPGYFIHPKAPERIKRMNKDIKYGTLSKFSWENKIILKFYFTKNNKGMTPH